MRSVWKILITSGVHRGKEAWLDIAPTKSHSLYYTVVPIKYSEEVASSKYYGLLGTFTINGNYVYVTKVMRVLFHK